MSKFYYSLGLMSGTSMDGVDTSIIQSDGENKYKVIKDKYFKYPKDVYGGLTTLRDKIKTSKDLKRFEKQTKSIEKEITLFHAKAVNEILKKSEVNVDFIGFHGQTIFHNAEEKISRQLGDGKLLSKLTKKRVVYNFRQNDIKNGGQGTPLTPVFHKVIAKKFNLIPVYFLNIGGITNYTLIDQDTGQIGVSANDIGPGMCLIDQWVRTNSKKRYDEDGKLAKSGKIHSGLLEETIRDFGKLNKVSYDIKDFDGSFVRDLSLKDGAATLTQFTLWSLIPSLNFIEEHGLNLVLCGGGRKNKFLTDKIKKKISNYHLIDDFGIDGDFVESQAFAYLAIRSYLKKFITFPSTTRVRKPCLGGLVFKI